MRLLAGDSAAERTEVLPPGLLAMVARSKFFALPVIVLCLSVATSRAESGSPDSLKGAGGGLFRFGVAAPIALPRRPADWPLLLAQFNSVTPENCLKPDPVQTAEGKFNFTEADAFVDFAAARHLQIVGHCLVWAKDDRTPGWFFRDGQQTAGRDLLLTRLKDHIDTVVGRYRGRIAMWDVVNEALDDSSEFLRQSGWSRTCGEEFIAKAFEFAHAADPEALLVYNDYNTELPAKRAKLVRLVQSLKTKHVPIHAVGLQGHYEIDRLPLKELEATLVDMHKLRVNVVISELDMDVIPRGRWWADGGNIATSCRSSIPTTMLARVKSSSGRPSNTPSSSVCFASTPTRSFASRSGTFTTARAGSIRFRGGT